MNVMNKGFLVALCAMTVVSAQAEGYFWNKWIATAKQTVAPAKVVAPVNTSMKTKIMTALSSAKNSCANAVVGVASHVKAHAMNLNKNVDTLATTKMPWLKTHTNVLTVSKAVVVSAAVATTCYALKKAYDKVKALRAQNA